MFIAMVAALAVAAIVVFGVASPTQALAADDDGSATTTADIVLVAPGGDGSGSGSGNGSTTRGATTRTGDPLAWGSLLAVAALAGGVAVFARRQALAGVSGSPAPTRSAHARPSVRNRTVVGSRTASASATRRRPGAYARPSAHARSGSHAKRSAVNWGRVGVAALAVALVALAASTVMVFSARAANDTIRIEMQQAEDGSWSGTATYYVNNDATYYRDLAKITEAAANGFNLEDGSVAITMAPASDPDDAITSPDAVKGAATSGGATWRIAGSAVSEDHNLALKVTATAKSLKPGDNTVGTATFDMTAPPYEDLRVRLNASPVVGMPLAASVSGAPEEATNDFTYTWLVSDDGENWTAIPGATSATFTPTPDLAGKRISVSLGCANPAWFIVQPASHNAKAPTSRAAAEGEHTVVFDVHGHGDAPAAQIVSDGAYATQPADPTASGFTFGGWFADEECTQPFSFSTTPITEDMTLHALWVPDTTGTFTVVHMLQSADDDDDYDEGAREVRTGEFSGNLADIQKSFPGFSLNVAKSPESSDEDGALVLRVYYDRRAYTVTYHVDNDIFHQETQVRYGATITPPSPDPELVGKVFEGWTTDGTALYDFAKPVTGDLDLYAKFSVQKLTVTFETWDQAPKPDDQTVEYGDTPTKPSSPVEGQGSPKFQGWFADASYATLFDFTAPVHANATVYAKYSPNVLVDFQGKAPNVSFPKQYDSTFAESELAGVTAPGYDIVDDKWYKDASFSTKWDFPITMDDDKVIYPKLSARTDTPYKVEHYQADLTGGAYTLADTDNLQGTTATDTAAAAKAYAGFTCEGTEQGGDGTITQATIAGDGKTVVKVYYKRNTDTSYTVEHWLQNTADNDYTHDTGADQTLKGTTGAATAAAAKTYAGFTAQAITQGTIAGDGTTVVKVYYDRATYTVTYDVQGHGDTPDPVTGVRHGSTLSNMPAPTATGYTFEGWYKDANCTVAWNAGTDMVTGDITLYAKWEGRPYKIIFNANSAPEGSSQTMNDISTKVGQSTTLTENAFTREGWTFAGWDTAADGTGTHYDDKASSSTFSEDGTDVVLYAQWIGKSGIGYKVEHYLEDGFGAGTYTLKDTDNLTGTAGAKTAAAPKATADYDDFVCSGTTQGGDGTIEQQAIRGDGNTVVKVYYKKGVCTVTFQAWGQTVANPASPQRVAHGGTATKPTTPAENAGNPKFEGWYTDASFTSAFDFTTAITSDITLYGKFSPRVTVKFMLWDGSTAGSQVGESSVPLVMTGDPASAQLTSGDLTGVVVPAGYTLSGTDYYTDAACGDILSLPKEGITDDSTVVYGRVTANTDTKYKVEHYQQSVSDESSYQLVATDEKEGTTGADTAAAANTPAGFTLEGTTKGGTGTIDQQPIAGDGSTVVAIYYKRDTVNYKVEHYQQDVTGSGYTKVVADDEMESAKTGATTEAVAKTYTGFEAKAFSQETVKGDGSTVVKIYYDRETFTVTFHEQGHGKAPGTQTVRYGGTATKPADPTETGYDFDGWFQEAGCTNAFNFTQTVTENKDAYAKWTIQRFLVSFLVEEVMANKPADQTVDYGGTATQPTGAIAKTGYHLIGWFKDAGYTTAFDFAAELIKATTSVYGHFAADTYTVAYDANDGSSGSTVSGLPSNQVKTYGVDLTLSSAKPTRQSTPSGTKYTVTYNANGGTADRAFDTADVATMYTFTGWNTNADGTSGTAYTAGATYTANEPATLYAQWSSEGGTTPVTLPSATKSGYRFAGWYTAASSTGTYVGAAGGSYAPTGNTTLYAHYSTTYLQFENYGSSGAQKYEGSGSMEIQPVDRSAGYTVNSCTLTPPDSSMKFVGWNTQEDGRGRWVLDGERINANDNTMTFTNDGAGGQRCTLYAQWSHLAGLTASELADKNAYATYAQHVGDVWIPMKSDGTYDTLNTSGITLPNGAYTTEVSKVLICHLIGAGHDGENLLTFASQLIPISNVKFGGNGIWRDSTLRTSMNDSTGAAYKLLPDTLKDDGVVKAVEKTAVLGSMRISSTDKFWAIGYTEVTGDVVLGTSYTDGTQYTIGSPGGLVYMTNKNVGIEGTKWAPARSGYTAGSMKGWRGNALSNLTYDAGTEVYFNACFCL